MADEERLREADAFAMRQRRKAREVKQRADALRDDAADRKQRAAEHYAATIRRVRRGDSRTISARKPADRRAHAPDNGPI